MKTREEYKKKIALCDKLGASKFQKVVLKVEELKFKLIKTVFPRFIEHYDKYCDRKRDKKLEQAETEEERKKIITDYRNQKIAMRRELNREQNRNYHMDDNKPTEFLYYLNWNKNIHKKGLIKNAAAIAGLTGALILGIAPQLAVVAMGCELFGAFINFQCINIQNSHIYRYEMLESNLKRREESRNKSNLANYSQAAKVYARSIEGTMDIPTLKQLIENVKTPEEATELRNMIRVAIKANAKRKMQHSKQIQQDSPSPETTEVQKVISTRAIPRLDDESKTPNQPINKSTVVNVRINVDSEIEKMLSEQMSTGTQSVKTESFQKSIGGK